MTNLLDTIATYIPNIADWCICAQWNWDHLICRQKYIKSAKQLLINKYILGKWYSIFKYVEQYLQWKSSQSLGSNKHMTTHIRTYAHTFSCIYECVNFKRYSSTMQIFAYVNFEGAVLVVSNVLIPATIFSCSSSSSLSLTALAFSWEICNGLLASLFFSWSCLAKVGLYWSSSSIPAFSTASGISSWSPLNSNRCASKFSYERWTH